MDNIITIILATAGVSTAVSTIANHVMTFGKLGNKAVNNYVNKALSPHFDKIHTELDGIKDQINEIKDENDRREMQTTKSKFNEKRFAEEQSDIYESYLEESTSYTLRKGKGE